MGAIDLPKYPNVFHPKKLNIILRRHKIRKKVDKITKNMIKYKHEQVL